MIEFKESKFYKLLQDFFINNDKETFIQFLAEFYNKTEGIIIKNEKQDEIIKELREMFLLFNEEGIDENIVREKVNYFVENNEKIQDIRTKLIANTNNIKNVNSQLDSMSTVVDKYVFLNTDGTDDKAIERALMDIPNGGEVVFSNREYIISKTITLKTGQRLKGQSRHTTIKLKDNSNCDVISLASLKEKRCEIRDITIDGNKDNQSCGSGLSIINDYTHEYYDIRHVIDNVLILRCKEKGLVVRGRGESIFSKIQVQEIGTVGFDIETWDSFFDNLSAGHCGEEAFLLNTTNCRFTTLKAWGSKIGINLKGKRNSLVNCDTQDTIERGIQISGKNNSIVTNIESVGWDYIRNTKTSESIAIELLGGADYNYIIANISDRAEFSTVGETIDYALYLNSNFNNINIIVKDVLNDIKNKDNIILNNIIELKGTDNTGKYLFYETIYKNLETKNSSGNGFSIGANAEKSYIAPFENGVQQWNKAIEFQNGKYSIANTLVPRNASTDIGSTNEQFRRLYLNSGLICGNVTYATNGISATGDLWLNGFNLNSTNKTLIPVDDQYVIGSATKRIKDIFLVNSPNVSSKRDLKENIEIFDNEKAYNSIKNLNIYTYNFKEFNEDGEYIGVSDEKMLGSIYEELPIECLNEKCGGVDLYAYTSYCISALKKAIEKIELLENEIKMLKH